MQPMQSVFFAQSGDIDACIIKPRSNRGNRALSSRSWFWEGSRSFRSEGLILEEPRRQNFEQEITEIAERESRTWSRHRIKIVLGGSHLEGASTVSSSVQRL